jgi:ABC-type transport system substrate-binding protein
MRLNVAGLALVVACTAVPAPTTITEAVPSAAAPAPTTTATTYQWVPDPDFTIRVGVDVFPVFDPLLTELDESTAGPYGVPQQPSLYRLVPPTSTLIPLLASDAEPPLGQDTDDGWEIVVNLRPGVTWSDGTPVDAADIAYSFRSFQGFERTVTWGSPLLHTVEAITSSTVRLVWERRPTVDEWQLGVALAPIISADFWESQPERSEGGFDEVPGLDTTAIPTTGPYRLVEDGGTNWALEAIPDWWEAGSSFQVWENGAVRYRNPTLELDETYGEPDGEIVAEWTVGPYASRVEYRVFGDTTSLTAALIDGDIDLILTKRFKRSLASLIETAELEILRSPSSTLYWVAFNTQRPPFDDQTARRAAACTFDAEYLADTVLAGAAAATGWTPSLGAWSVNPELVCAVADSTKELDGVRIRMFTLGPSYDPVGATAGLHVAEWLRERAGAFIPTEEYLLPGPGLVELLNDPNRWDMVMMRGEISSQRPGVDLETVSLATGWDPPESQVLEDRLHDAFDLATAQAAYRDLQLLWADQLPATPLLRLVFLEFFNPTTISPPFLTATRDGPTSPLLDGLQAWEDWVIPAIRSAG